MTMKNILILIICFVCVSNAQSNNAQSNNAKIAPTFYGEKMEVSAKNPLVLNEAILKKEFGKIIQLTGYITKSCAKKGCWMVMEDGKTSMRVTFKDYGFFVPLGF